MMMLMMMVESFLVDRYRNTNQTTPKVKSFLVGQMVFVRSVLCEKCIQHILHDILIDVIINVHTKYEA